MGHVRSSCLHTHTHTHKVGEFCGEGGEVEWSYFLKGNARTREGSEGKASGWEE